MTRPIYGVCTQLGIDTTNPVAQRFMFQDCGLEMDEETIWAGGLPGTREKDIGRQRNGIRRVQGPLIFQPNALEMQKLLPWLLGGTPSGSTYPLAETIPDRYVTADRSNALFGGSDGKVFTYNNAKANRGTFEAGQGEPLKLTIDCVAADETVANNGTFPALSIDEATTPWMMFDAAITIGGVSYSSKEIRLTVDNHLDLDRFFNSPTLSTNANAKDRDIGVSLMLPYGDATAVYGSGNAGVAIVITFTNGLDVLTFTMSKVVFPRKGPHIRGREEVMVAVEGQARSNGATASLATTLTTS